jgi:hypothetical protein
MGQGRTFLASAGTGSSALASGGRSTTAATEEFTGGVITKTFTTS